jgi:putative PIN family toxin of toxin-antitoxin system
VIDEFRRVSIEKIKVDSTMVDSFILEFITIAEVIGPPFEERYELRDPTDIDILAAAIKGKAEVLVSGDKDLLEFEHSPIRVLTPRACYDRLLHGA